MREETTERYYVRRREFLNLDPDLPAFIIGIVEDTREIPDDDPKRRWNEGTILLDLADCNRRVSFYFNMYDAVERANSLRKINLIADIVIAVRNAIAYEVESRNLRPRESEQVSIETKNENSQEDPLAQFFTSQFTMLGL